MNDGRICISICAETADEVINRIERAGKFADVIELRFDCLENSEIEKVLFHLKTKRNAAKIILATFRQPEQGGAKKLAPNERIDFWSNENVGDSADWADFEFDLPADKFNLNFQKTIRSFHLFNRTLLNNSPEFLSEFYEKLKISYPGSVFKIAVQADDIADTIETWKLLSKAKSENVRIIPIAMGEAGKWTRILSLAHGAFMTYAALEAGAETASGQITAHDLTEVYRVKQLNENTEIYGIVGNPVAHSLSPFMHNAAFRFYNLDAVFIPFTVKNLDEFIKKFVGEATREVHLNFKGFSATIPHKQTIIEHLDFVDETARAIGAVNTVKIENGKLHGYNTDAEGFIAPLKSAYGDLSAAKVAVVGSGGAARACVYALKNAGANVTVFARDLKKAAVLAEDLTVELKEFSNNDFNEFDVLVNTTPLGMRGKLERETPAFAAQFERVKLVYDLVYNPFETAFIREARKVNVPTLGGLAMLAAQGVKQFEIWTGKRAPLREMSAAALKRIKN